MKKVGSTFTYREFSIDANGREVAGTARTVTASVVSNDTTFGGGSGLTLFQEDSARYFVQYDDLDHLRRDRSAHLTTVRDEYQ